MKNPLEAIITTVFFEEACEAYGVDTESIPCPLWAAYPWDVHNIQACMVYAYDWALSSEDVKQTRKPYIVVGPLVYVGTPKANQIGQLEEAA